ncbi:phosphoglycerate mutase family protein [Aspergillus mulundensis]|uniref:Histidine phosphatase superfamily, clade-1 n=1 Tax=Aspergillus mulundensis TaxID=1810919 RepID=A0A3D8Q7Q1_9EURO|nr:Histidine phosphatase superfamily, clade-1 [Aspergillus mulundensis]RDW57853.1 Histidine phosphatase superfamily, clade-1 [Aspergillus mulundensis]
MAFRLHVVRHAEAAHNPNHDTTILDPPLTAKGIHQCTNLNRSFRFKSEVGLVVASPLRRTIQTALLGFQDTLDTSYYAAGTGGVRGGAKFHLEADLQAHSDRNCDTGSTELVLRAEFPQLPWDTFGLDPLFPKKDGLYAPDMESLRRRGLRVQRYLAEIFRELENTDRRDIVVVVHGGFMRFLGLGDNLTVEQGDWETFNVTFTEDNRMEVVRS